MGCVAALPSNAHAVEDIDVFTAEAEPRWQKSGSATFSELSGDAPLEHYSSDDSNATEGPRSRRGVKVGTTARERRERQLMLKNKRVQKECAFQAQVQVESQWQKSGSATFSEVSSAAESDAASAYYSSEASTASAISKGSKVGTTAKERRERQIMLRNKRLLKQ